MSFFKTRDKTCPKQPLLAADGLWLFRLSGRDNVYSTARCIAAAVTLVVKGNGSTGSATSYEQDCIEE